MRWEEMGDQKRFEFALSRYIPQDTIIEEGVLVMGNVKLGRCCHLKAYSCLGSKGFSWGFDEDGVPYPIFHEGGVVLGDYVEIGVHSHVACATIKGANTVLGDYVKLDDSVHIAHNCRIGKAVIIAAGATIGGGVVIGDYAWIGLGAVIKQKVKVGKYALVGSGANVVSDVPDGMVVVGNPARVVRERKHE